MSEREDEDVRCLIEEEEGAAIWDPPFPLLLLMLFLLSLLVLHCNKLQHTTRRASEGLAGAESGSSRIRHSLCSNFFFLFLRQGIRFFSPLTHFYCTAAAAIVPQPCAGSALPLSDSSSIRTSFPFLLEDGVHAFALWLCFGCHRTHTRSCR